MLAPHFEKNWLVVRKLAYAESGSNECARCMRIKYTAGVSSAADENQFVGGKNGKEAKHGAACGWRCD